MSVTSPNVTGTLITHDGCYSPDRLRGLAELIALRLSELPPRGSVAVVMAPDPAAVAALLATLCGNRPAVLLPPAISDVELHDVLASGRSSHLLVPAAQRWGTKLGPADPIWSGDGVELFDLRASFPNFEESGLSASGEPDGLLPGEPCICQLTSGSLGASRLAVRTVSGLAAEIRAIVERLDLNDQDRVLTASSIAHSYGSIGGLLAPLSIGASVALAAIAEEACELAARYQPTVVFALATTYQALLRHPGAGDALAGARALFSAGAPLPDGLFDTFQQRFGLPIRQDYGTTETGTISMDFPSRCDPATVGIPLPHVEVRIGLPSEGPLDPGEQGEVQVRGEAIAGFYLTKDGVESALDADGWYHTGDVARIDADGRLRLGRRLRRPIRIGNIFVRPEVIERRVAALAGVKEAAVLACPSGLRLVAVASELTVEQLSACCRETLSPEEQPAHIELVAELPRSPAGKVLHKYI